MGVLAHEIGHVVHRHTTRMVVEQGVLQMGLGLALGDVSTGSALLTGLHYRRSHERERVQLLPRLNRGVACYMQRIYHVACNAKEFSMTTAQVNARVQKHRDALRQAGLRPVQLWVPDTRRPNFAKECQRQSLLAAQADGADPSLQLLMDAAMADITGWTD